MEKHAKFFIYCVLVFAISIPQISCTTDFSDIDDQSSEQEPTPSGSTNSDQTPVKTSSVICGDALVGQGELCDKHNLNQYSCQTLGYLGGDLFCSSDCRSFDTSHCFMKNPNPVFTQDCSETDFYGQIGNNTMLRQRLSTEINSRSLGGKPTTKTSLLKKSENKTSLESILSAFERKSEEGWKDIGNRHEVFEFEEPVEMDKVIVTATGDDLGHFYVQDGSHFAEFRIPKEYQDEKYNEIRVGTVITPLIHRLTRSNTERYISRMFGFTLHDKDQPIKHIDLTKYEKSYLALKELTTVRLYGRIERSDSCALKDKEDATSDCFRVVSPDQSKNFEMIMASPYTGKRNVEGMCFVYTGPLLTGRRYMFPGLIKDTGNSEMVIVDGRGWFRIF